MLRMVLGKLPACKAGIFAVWTIHITLFPPCSPALLPPEVIRSLQPPLALLRIPKVRHTSLPVLKLPSGTFSDLEP